MSQNFLWNANFHSLLKAIDEELADKARGLGCPECGHKLHQANYPRSPMGVPARFRSYYEERLSFCCEICRKRWTPPSVRFFGRRWYPGPLFMLISAFMGRINDRLFIKVKEWFGISVGLSTWKRWRQWWYEVFPFTLFWKQAQGIVPVLETKRSFPRALLGLFQGKLEEKICSLLKFLSPLSYGFLRAF